jgi:hypothetical protein
MNIMAAELATALASVAATVGPDVLDRRLALDIYQQRDGTAVCSSDSVGPVLIGASTMWFEASVALPVALQCSL